MSQGTLLLDLVEVKLVGLRPGDGAVQIELLTCRLFSSSAQGAPFTRSRNTARQRFNRLAAQICSKDWWAQQDSNLRLPPCEGEVEPAVCTF